MESGQEQGWAVEETQLQREYLGPLGRADCEVKESSLPEGSERREPSRTEEAPEQSPGMHLGNTSGELREEPGNLLVPDLALATGTVFLLSSFSGLSCSH